MSLKNKKIISIILILLFFIISLGVITNFKSLLSFDKTIQTFSSTLHSPTLDQTMLSVTKIGNTYESLLIYIVLGLFLISKKKKGLFYLFTIITAIGTILPEIIKNLTERARPLSNLLIETGYSFPSGHATISTIFIISSIIIISSLIKNRLYKYLYSTISICIFSLVIFSRLYLSVHWFSDVLGGILLGLICYMLTSISCCQKKENML